MHEVSLKPFDSLTTKIKKMQKLLSIALVLLLATSKNGFSQSTNCPTAVTQLQNYAAQVNQFYYNEYWTVIPNVRCPAVNAWGQPYNPALVQNCRLQMLSYLNNWYGQQCMTVNNWYAQIARSCSAEPQTNIVKPAPPRISGSDENSEIDTDEIEELTAGIDEEKAVKITIPKTPQGFKPRQ